MSGVHKYPTISFRISPRERDEIEAKIKASGMQKKDYFVRSCQWRGVVMSGVHKYPTISFRISPRERDEIEAKIKASGMQKKDYFVRSCIYNKV